MAKVIQTALPYTARYTPVASSFVNCSVTVQEISYLVIGNFVTMVGIIDINPTNASAYTSFDITLPISRNTTEAGTVSGSAHSFSATDTDVFGVVNSSSADECNFVGNPSNTANSRYYLNISYILE